MRLSVFTRDGLTVGVILLVSAAVGALIFAYGVAVRDVCLGAGLGALGSNILALIACVPILAALHSIDG